MLSEKMLAQNIRDLSKLSAKSKHMIPYHRMQAAAGKVHDKNLQEEPAKNSPMCQHIRSRHSLRRRTSYFRRRRNLRPHLKTNFPMEKMIPCHCPSSLSWK